MSRGLLAIANSLRSSDRVAYDRSNFPYTIPHTLAEKCGGEQPRWHEL